MEENIHKKIENKVIDLIIAGASGRLIVFKPEKSDKDLVIEKRGDYKKQTIALNIYERKISGGQEFKEEIYQLSKSIIPRDNFYLAFIDFNIIKQDIDDNFWVIPSSELQSLTEGSDFSKFLINKQDFIRFLMERLI